MKKSKNKHKKGKGKEEPQNLQEIIIKILDMNPSMEFSFKELSKQIGFKDHKSKMQLEALLEHFAKRGIIQKTGEDLYKTNTEAEYVVGKVDYVSRDFAYIICEGLEEDVWVSTKHMERALDGDLVRVMLHKYTKSSRPEGEVIEILERKRTEFVGKIEISHRYAFVVPDHRKMFNDIFIRLDDIKDAKTGDKVVAVISSWKPQDKNPTGYVKQVLGKAGEHNAEIHSIMAEYGLPMEFPPPVVKEAEALDETISAREIAKRRDFRNITTFTIDPVDAKDFDDALSIRKLENGNWEIGVHIADVSHYVRPDTILDHEAFRRGTSVYLVDRVVPMLPEKLSNMVCSLRPHEDKLTFSAVFEMDEDAQVHDMWFGKTIIHSARRFSYEEVQEVIENEQGDFVEEILTLNSLAHQLRKERFKKGSISFESVEVKFRLDENHKPVEIIPKIRKDAHKLIEDFMLLANKYVAEFVYKMKRTKDKNTMVYRTHDRPDPEKLENFVAFAKQFGHTIKTDEKAIAKSLNKLSTAIEGKPEQHVLQQLAVRTMAKAKYTTDAEPHFGLAFKHYTHFTSPIRRYPDLMVHRLLEHYLEKGESVPKAIWEEKCKHSSEMEKKAADAERASIKYKQVELMQTMYNRDLKGIISGVTEWGIYVEVVELACEGMIRLSDLQDDFYEYYEKKHCVVGRRYKKVYQLGDKVIVRVKATNLEKRTIDFWLVQDQNEVIAGGDFGDDDF